MKPVTFPPLSHPELLERLHIAQRQPHLHISLINGQSLAGQALSYERTSLVLSNRDGVWYIDTTRIAAIGLSGIEAQHLCKVQLPHEPLTKLGLARLISAESPPGWSIQVDEELLKGNDFGWLRPWVAELSEAIVGITGDSLGMAALEQVTGFLLTRGQPGSVVNRDGVIRVAADPDGPKELAEKLLALL